jgi:hypothetical protein
MTRSPWKRALEQMKLSALGSVELLVGVAFYAGTGVGLKYLIDWATNNDGFSDFDQIAVSIMQVAAAMAFVAHGLLSIGLGLRLAYLAIRKDWNEGDE